MEVTQLKRSTRKVVNVLMIVMVLAGAIAFTFMSANHAGGELVSRMFLVFFGLIIAVQVIPGLMLFGVMLKEMLSVSRKEEVRK